MTEKYAIESYDKHLCLRMNDTLWVILLFLLRPYLVTIISLVNRTDRTGLIDMVYSDKLVLWWAFLAGIPAVFVVYAWNRRRPGASMFARKVWRRGRELLAVSALCNIAVVFMPLWLGLAHHIDKVGWVQFAISLAIAVTLYSSPYIKDCFADFPEEDADDNL